MKNIITNCWNGKEDLWIVFWVYGMAIQLICEIAMEYISVVSQLVRFLLTAVFYAWLVWNLVSIWRCAFNCEREIWGFMARATVVINFLVLGNLLI